MVKVEKGERPDLARIQAGHVAAFRAAHPLGDAARVSQGLAVIPTDVATGLGPALGWSPARADGAGAGRHVGEVRPSGPLAG